MSSEGHLEEGSIEDKAEATHEVVSYMVGHLLWGPVHAGLLWSVPGLVTLCCYFMYLEGSSDTFCLFNILSLS